ncbi:unnamed protein product [Urochloa humidicola]
MHLLVALLILLPRAPFSAAAGTNAGDGAGGCGRQCNNFVVPYPFGFSGDCPILLSCNATTSTALLPHSTEAVPYPIVSFSPTTSTFVVSLAPTCNRSVAEAQASLAGTRYDVSYRTGLFLRDDCRLTLPAASGCLIPSDVMAKLLHMSPCGDANGTTWTCVTSTPSNPNSAAAASGVGQFISWDDVVTAGCDDVLTATVYGDTSMDFGVAELGWWLDGGCDTGTANATAAGSRCAANATCHDVVTPSGAWAHRCACQDGMLGDGFVAGEGCHYAKVLKGGNGKVKVMTVMASGLSAGFILLIIGLSSFVLRRKRGKDSKVTKKAYRKKAPKDDTRLFRGRPVDDDLEEGDTGPRRFCYDDLAAATEDFSDDRRLGSGVFGSVYRGYLTDANRDVAVKRVSKTSRQGWKEFVSEVRIISRLRHRNLVQLIGWCHSSDDELLLVYELMPNGSLDAHLYGPEHVLTWPVRYGIALGVGAALLYLHEDAEQRVVHRDIKPSNVMLDAAFRAKLGDFGLARLIDDGRRSHTTGVAGTMGYMDTECMLSGRVDVTSDVYSFGVLLLEITCGRRPAVRMCEEDEYFVHLIQWVWESYGGGSILDAADTRMEGKFDGREMACAMVVGLWCAHPDRSLRPTIRQAVNVLRFEAPPPNLPAKMPVATYGPPADRTGTITSSYGEPATASDGGSNVVGRSRGMELQLSDDESNLMKWQADKPPVS